MYRPYVTPHELRVAVFCPFYWELASWIGNFVVMQLVSECRGKETVTLWPHCNNHVYIVTKHIILSLFSYVILPMYGIW